MFYSYYNTAGYFWEDYSKISGVELNDIIFAWWALIMTLTTFTQCFCIGYEHKSNRVSKLCKVMSLIYWAFAIVYILLTNVFDVIKIDTKYLNSFFMLSYLKLFISLTKYMPQAYWNFKRKSTKGWSIFNIFLDFTGGSFSML